MMFYRSIYSDIFLDIGNVLYNLDLDNYCNFISDWLSHKGQFKNDKEVLALLESIQLEQDLGYFGIAKSLMNRGIVFSNEEEISKFESLWDKTITLNQGTVRFVKSCLESGLKVNFLSNMGFEHKRKVLLECNDFINLCGKHFSCDIGARKPSKLFYQSFFIGNTFEPWQTSIFLDDKLENVKAATAFFTDSKQFNLNDYNNDDEVFYSLSEILGVK